VFFRRTLLTCWVLVVATGAVVGHRHDAAPGHAHGYGWVSLTASTGGVSGAHHHFVFLGIELGAIPDAPERSDAPDVPHAGSAFEASVTPPDTASDHRAPNAVCVAIVVEPLTFAAALDPPAATPSSTCPLVTRARTGVLRT
jgi:hypothetical protein